VKTDDKLTVKEAKSELEGIYGPEGYKVKQIKKVDGETRALLSVR
jgi:hypothetical protein